MPSHNNTATSRIRQDTTDTTGITRTSITGFFNFLLQKNIAPGPITNIKSNKKGNSNNKLNFPDFHRISKVTVDTYEELMRGDALLISSAGTMFLNTGPPV